MNITRISKHFDQRAAERLGLFMRSETEKAHFLKCVNEKSTFVEYQEHGRSLHLTMVYDKFYLTVVDASDGVLITVIYADSKRRRTAMEQFEKTHVKDLSDPDIMVFCNWRAQVVENSFWKNTEPKLYTNTGKRYGPKMVLLWGGDVKLAIWDDYVWTDSNNNELDEHLVWGWQDVEQYERHQLKKVQTNMQMTAS